MFLNKKSTGKIIRRIKNELPMKNFLISKKGVKRFFLHSLRNVIESKNNRSKKGYAKLRRYLKTNNVKLNKNDHKIMKKNYLKSKSFKEIKKLIVKNIKNKNVNVKKIKGKDNKQRRFMMISNKGKINNKNFKKRYSLKSKETRREFLVSLGGQKHIDNNGNYILKTKKGKKSKKSSKSRKNLKSKKLINKNSNNKRSKLISKLSKNKRFKLDSKAKEIERQTRIKRFKLDSIKGKRHQIKSDAYMDNEEL